MDSAVGVLHVSKRAVRKREREEINVRIESGFKVSFPE